MGISNYNIAVDAALMQPRFQSEIVRFCGKEADIKTIYVTRLFPRKDGGFSIEYELIIDNGTIKNKIKLWGHLPGPTQTLPGFALAPRLDLVIFDDINLAVPVFPYDPKLKYLADYIGTNETVKGNLGRIKFLSDLNFEIIECGLLGYRLERRCVIRYLLEVKTEGGVERIKIAVKIAPPKKIAGAIEIVKCLAANGFGRDSTDGLTVPELLGYDKKHGVMLMEFAPGRSLHAMIGEQSFAEFCGEAGKSLRKLHSISMKNLPEYSVNDELDSLREKVDIIANVFPETAGAYADVYAAIVKEKIVDDYSVVPVHRDFYDKQTLHLPGRTTLLDFDNLALADPALDYGNFMAHLTLRRAQTPECEAVIRRGAESFEAGYGSVDGKFKRRAGWWKDAALMRLAILYSLRPRWKSIAPDLMFEIESSRAGNNILSGEKR